MFGLTVWFGPTNAQATLLFRTAEAVEAAENILKNPIEYEPVRRIVDDFGQTFSILSKNINAMMTEDMTLASEGRIEIALQQTRTQANAQKRAEADPQLMAMARAQRGPSVLTPFQNGGFPRN